MKIAFHGAAKEVGRSCIIINDEIMLDCGLKISEQGSEYPLPLDYEKIRAVFLSHAHLDHTGALPYFNEEGLSCGVYATRLTKNITRILLKDSLHIAQLQHEHPAYTKENIDNVTGFIQNVEYNSAFRVKDIIARYLDAGHIPGSASILLEIDGVRLLYTGDVNTKDTRLLKGASYSANVDVMVLEATYGNRDHPDRREEEVRFTQKVKETVVGGGSAIIPVFSVGRAQEIILILKDLNIAPIYLDGMAKEVTRMILEQPDYVNNAANLGAAMKKVKLARQADRSSLFTNKGIFITTAGMIDGGPVIEYIEMGYLDDKNAILLTGYQCEGTNGRLLLQEGKVRVDGHELKFKGKIDSFDFSAHCGQKELVEFVGKIKPKIVFLQHGDEQGVMSLANLLKNYRVIIPELGQEVQI